MPGPGWQLAAPGHRAEPVHQQEQQGLPTTFPNCPCAWTVFLGEPLAPHVDYVNELQPISCSSSLHKWVTWGMTGWVISALPDSVAYGGCTE